VIADKLKIRFRESEVVGHAKKRSKLTPAARQGDAFAFQVMDAFNRRTGMNQELELVFVEDRNDSRRGADGNIGLRRGEQRLAGLEELETFRSAAGFANGKPDLRVVTLDHRLERVGENIAFAIGRTRGNDETMFFLAVIVGKAEPRAEKEAQHAESDD